MQFITTDQRIAIENFEVGVVYTVAFTSGDSFTGACIGIGPDFVAFQRTAPKLLFCLTMTTAADIAGIDPLGDEIGKIIEYTGTVPTTIKTDGTPLIDLLISGNEEHTGTPTPDNPIMSQGTGERTGNLLPFSDKTFVITAYGSNLMVTCNGGNLYLSGTVGEIPSNYNMWKTNFAFELEAGTYYCNSPSPLGNNFGRYIKKYDDDSNLINSNTYIFTLAEKTKCYLSFYIYKKSIDSKIELMLNTGSTALPYEPFGYKILISSASTTTPVYLGEVETTRQVKKLVLDGTETITEELTNVYSIPINDTVTAGAGLSTHFEYDSTVLAGQFRIEAGKAVFGYNDTLANFSTFLAAQYAAGTPVTIWYVLATEETAVVNEPLMRIGEYADTLSYRQSGVNIPTTDGLNIFNIDTTVKPSEVYLKYFSPIF